MELSRLENTLKIMKSNCQCGTTIMVTTKLCPQVPHLHILWALLGMATPPFPWAACSSAWQPFPWNYYFPKYPIWTSPGATWANFLLYLSRSLQSHRVTLGMDLGAGRLFSVLPSSLHSVFESDGNLHSVAIVMGVFKRLIRSLYVEDRKPGWILMNSFLNK